MGIAGRPQRRRIRRAAGAISAAGAAALAIVTFAAPGAIDARQQSMPVDIERQARATCGSCHAYPPPDILPRACWRDEFVRMMFIREGRTPPIGPPGVVNRSVQLPADMEQVLPFYVSHAPERLPPPEAWPQPGTAPLSFTRRAMNMTAMTGAAAVSHVRLVDLDGDGQLDVLGTDMRQGLVFSGNPGAAGGALTEIASIPHPAHVTLADVDRDGVQDLLVAEMGEFFPADHAKGAAIWMRGLAKGKYGAFWLDGWPRVASVDAADFNGDGKTDLAVAAFGWRKTGQVAVLENRTANPSQPSFTTHTIDPRAGSIQLVPADLNRDGRMDFVTLLAQEHETVLAYINTGLPAGARSAEVGAGFAFERQVVYAAPHPNWGSSGFELVDLDKDGDLDVLLTHGDTFDDGIVKPYHGIQWLENRGGYPFVDRPIAPMPGVHRAQAADLDGDGDLDIVAAALLAGGSDVDEKTLPALAWLEQTAPGTFTRHTIEMGFPRHATLDLGDVDRDGDIDIVTGNFSIGPPTKSWVDVWVNGRKGS
jgi:hypothetical protein